jgi:ribosomal protein S18 acetylase RimI-like enzyme
MIHNQSVHIYQAGPSDADTIAQLSVATFRETYGAFTSPENMEVHIAEHFSPDIVRKELSEPGYRFFLATLGDRPVGFIKLRADRQPRGLPDQSCLEIQRIYVLQEFQGASIGKELMQLAKQLAKEGSYKVLWLQVWQKNEKAIRFYQKSGFVIYETTSFPFGRETNADYLMRFDLYN